LEVWKKYLFLLLLLFGSFLTLIWIAEGGLTRGSNEEIQLPVLISIGFLGVILLMISPVYAISKFRDGEYDSLLWAFAFIMIGFGMVIAWLWG